MTIAMKAIRPEPKVEKLLGEVISGYYLDEQQRSMEHAHRELSRLCRRESLPIPAYDTVRSRIEAIAPKERAVRRHGLAAASRFNINDGTVPNVDLPYAVIQIDHTLIDLMLVDDEHRVAIGRPWLTVAIDVYSRMVAGYYVSFDPPGALGTGICIANAMLSKESFLAKLGLDVSYPCMGKPRVIHVDNAKEFRGETLKRACMEYGIDLVFRRVKTPNYGGHIERHLGTLAGEIHALPGTTFSNPQDCGDYDSEKRAAMTLPEFERWLANLIVGAYHHRPHGALGKPPIKRYTDGILGSDTQPGIGSIHVFTDEERLRIDFLPIVERTIQHYGVAIDGIEYFADVLRRWVGAMEPDRKRMKRKFVFRRDPRDISSVLFYDPDVQQYFRIPYRNTAHPPISLWELRATQRFLAERGKRDVDDTQIFAAYDEMRRIEESAKTLTRKVRLQQTRRKQHRALNAPTNALPVEIAPPVDELVGSDIEPFDEIERF